MEEAEAADESTRTDVTAEHDHDDIVDDTPSISPLNKSGCQVVMNEYVVMLWSEERRQFDVKMQQLYEKLDLKSRRNRKMKRGTDSDFMDHLLDVHRSWCKACRPAIDREKNNRILQRSKSVDQGTQTMQTMPGPPLSLSFSGGQGSLHIKPMPPLAKIQRSIVVQKSATESDGGMGMSKRKLDDSSAKGPKVKVIKIIKSKSGLLRQETCMTQDSLKKLMNTSSKVGGANLKAVKPLQVVGGSGSSLPQGRYVLQGKRLVPVSESQSKPMKMQVIPIKKGQSNITPSSPASGVGTVPWTVNPAEPKGAYGAPGVGFGKTKCVDEDDNEEDDVYDDGNVKIDDKNEPVVTVKEEPLSDTEETPGFVRTDKEGWSVDQMTGQETARPEPEEEEEEEEFTDDEEDDEEEVDYEALEREDPSWSPSRDHKNTQKKAKDKSPSDQPGTSADLSEDDQDCLQSSGSEWDIESEDTDDDFDDFDEDEDKPSPKPKKRPVPCTCPVCSVTCKSATALSNHLQEHLPLEKGWKANKEAIESIENKYGSKYKKYTKSMGWCEECNKFCRQLNRHLQNVHKPKEKTLCVQCGKVVMNAKHHALTHLEVDESDYVQCPKCPSRFKHKTYLKWHMRRVHPKNTVVCPTCGKSFKTREYLRRHEVIHSDVKPYPCSECDLSFTQASNLKIHMRQHTGDKPYVCEICEMAFTNKVSLKKHKKKLHGIDWWKDREESNKEEPKEKH